MRSSCILFFLLIAFCCISTLTNAQTLEQDCNVLRRICDACTRSLNEGRDEDNIVGRLNINCRREIGTTWQNLNRCDLSVIRCRTLNRPLSCAQLVIEAARARVP